MISIGNLNDCGRAIGTQGQGCTAIDCITRKRSYNDVFNGSIIATINNENLHIEDSVKVGDLWKINTNVPHSLHLN